MAKLTIEITATVNAFSNYAEQLGYFEMVPSTDIDGNPISIANPETKEDFLQRKVKEAVVDKLSESGVRAIEREERTQRDADKQAVKDAISNAMTVSLT